jgi:hypothetical protein
MAISQGDVPEAARKHVPRHPLVSATLIGRLAVSKDRQELRVQKPSAMKMLAALA